MRVVVLHHFQENTSRVKLSTFIKALIIMQFFIKLLPKNKVNTKRNCNQTHINV